MKEAYELYKKLDMALNNQCVDYEKFCVCVRSHMEYMTRYQKYSDGSMTKRKFYVGSFGMFGSGTDINIYAETTSSEMSPKGRKEYPDYNDSFYHVNFIFEIELKEESRFLPPVSCDRSTHGLFCQ
jgi:hypothetical protein